ncbi:MAG: hypothetical protein A2285_01665 [Elusimicrobia bacterium RIFOXYA12_FULL_57_11]|nr:MAG: hypothetical protein A2285_01665 [Elusimicrobia bacterium RIFOXYA12_FULL_57_11]
MTGPGTLFNFHDCKLRFNSRDKELLSWLARDFSAFTEKPGSTPDISITAVLENPRRENLPAAALKTKVWHLLPAPPGCRRVWYPQGALCEYDYTARRGTIISQDRDLLKEISYLLILSRAGEALDLRGLHRLHAGALGYRGKAVILCGTQGTGKTTLLLELLKDNDFSLLSDDTPLISATGQVHPFPVRIGLAENSPHTRLLHGARYFHRRHYPPKRLLDIAGSGIKLSPPLPPGRVFKLVRGSAALVRGARPREAVPELLKSLAAGWGVPQMAEYFLRASPADILRKSAILVSRLAATAALYRKADFFIFETGPEPALNAAALKAFLRSGSGRDAAA